MEDIEFCYHGMPVGVFPGPEGPTREGEYPYRPLKGPGHADLLKDLEAQGTARCYYDTRLGRQLFDVRGLPVGGRIDLAEFHLSTLPDRNQVPWLDPWVPATREAEKALARELPAGHLLSGKRCRAVARRVDNDDVLFQVLDEGDLYAVVRLTWAGKPGGDPALPRTEVYRGLVDWVERRMKPDHAEFLGP